MLFRTMLFKTMLFKTMRNRQLKIFQQGMTLVELLVVVAIIGVLLAISVPILKTMLESRKTSNAAQVLAGTFRHARMKSIQEQTSYAVRLIPFENAPTAVIQLPMQKGGTIEIVNPPNVRVRVVAGKIVFYCFHEEQWQQVTGSLPDTLQREVNAARKHFVRGGSVQFNRLGRFINFSTDDNVTTLLSPYNALNLPEDQYTSDAMEYRISRPATTATWLPPVVMPYGTIVDLAFSGGGDKVPLTFSAWDEVVVTFSPMGNVDELSINGVSYKVNEILYFCVGDWDRQIDVNNNTLSEDGISNLVASATYWVTLHPKTGIVHTAKNAAIRSGSGTPEQAIRDARKTAREHFFNVGED